MDLLCFILHSEVIYRFLFQLKFYISVSHNTQYYLLVCSRVEKSMYYKSQLGDILLDFGLNLVFKKAQPT